MGVVKKPALGPNPLSVKKKQKKGNGDDSMLKKRRKRKGKRSKELSAQKKLEKENIEP